MSFQVIIVLTFTFFTLESLQIEVFLALDALWSCVEGSVVRTGYFGVWLFFFVFSNVLAFWDNYFVLSSNKISFLAFVIFASVLFWVEIVADKAFWCAERKVLFIFMTLDAFILFWRIKGCVDITNL